MGSIRQTVRAMELVGAVAVITMTMAGSGAAANRYPPDRSCQTNGVVRSILYSNGVAYLGGDFSQVAPAGVAMGATGTVARAHLAACDQQTGAILPWNPGANARVFSLTASGGVIYAGGAFTTLAGQPRKYLGALTAAGVATSWNPGANKAVYVVRIGPNGNIFAGGLFGKLAGKAHARIGQLTPQGAAVAWNVTVGQVSGSACPPRCPPVVYTIDFLGGRVYFGGQFGLVNGASRNTAAAVDLTTGALTAWNPNIYAPANCPTCSTVETSRVYTLIAAPASNRIYTCGGYWKVNGTRRSYNISAFNAGTGTLDPSLTVQDDGDTPGCAIRAGILYFGGHFNYAGSGCVPNAVTTNCVIRHHVGAVDLGSNTLLGWNPGANSNHGIYTVAADPSNVGFGGYQTKLGGVLQMGYGTYSATLP